MCCCFLPGQKHCLKLTRIRPQGRGAHSSLIPAASADSSPPAAAAANREEMGMHAKSPPWGATQQHRRGFQHFLYLLSVTAQTSPPRPQLQLPYRVAELRSGCWEVLCGTSRPRCLLGILPRGVGTPSECEPHYLHDSPFYLGLDCQEILLYS